MKFALVNPHWSFTGSVYFGCREPHLPLEFAYAQALLQRAGQEAEIIDAHLFDLPLVEVRERVAAYAPDFTVIATAPTYLFWRCPPPELRVPRLTADALRQVGGRLIAVGPHPSATPAAALHKLGTDAVVIGEFEEVLPFFTRENWGAIPSIAYRSGAGVRRQGKAWTAAFADFPPLVWPETWLRRHRHHHHRFDLPPTGPGAEVEASRGCPYHCHFCAKENFRGTYRRRPLSIVLQEIDRLLASGVEYLYFIDETFFPDEGILFSLAQRPVRFGIQTRIDLWSPELLQRLGRAGCVSIEAGVESLSPQGRRQLGKPCRLSTAQIVDRLALAKEHVPFVQANLMQAEGDHPEETAAWREALRAHGVWANDPVPLFPYPGSPAYRRKWGEPDDLAWERAHSWYLRQHPALSDLQESAPLPLEELELAGGRYG